MTGRPNKTKNAVRVLEAFLDDPTKEVHGFRLVESLKIKSGVLYPLLIRYENIGWLESHWEKSDAPGPRKRLYRLTAEGAPAARRFVSEARLSSIRPRKLGGFDGPPEEATT
jgi:PadR family transcriptional regulator PadR